MATSAPRKYRTWPLRKRSGNGTRPISDPLPELKSLQTRVKIALLDILGAPEFSFGGVPGRSAQDNAAIHVGQPEVVTLDFRAFFQTISASAVTRIWKRQFGAGRDAAKLLTQLTTYDGMLPQGAPTSTALANLAAQAFARQVFNECGRRGLRFSIYVDDMTISGVGAHLLINWIASNASRHGLTIERKKTQVAPKTKRQMVTGFVVNRRISVPEERVLKARRLQRVARSPDGTARDIARADGLMNHIRHASPGQARRARG